MLKRLVAGLLMIGLSGAGALAQSISYEQAMAAPLAVQVPSTAIHSSRHKCCHSNSLLRFEITIPLPPSNMPCGSEHACCVRPGPANVAEVPFTPGQQRQDAQQREVVPADSGGAVTLPAGTVFHTAGSLPYDAFNPVLRI